MPRKLAALLALAACTAPAPDPRPSGVSRSPVAERAQPSPAPSHEIAQERPARPAEPSSTDAAIDAAEADAILFADATQRDARTTACPPGASPRERVDCLIALRYATDPVARDLALDLYDRFGVLVGVEAEHVERMGWRGAIHIVPEVAAHAHRRHLAWLSAAVHDYDDLFRGLDPDGRLTLGYAWHPFAVRTMRSVNRTTPSAYAAFERWEIAYNVSGSLNTSAEAVRELLFHELFHRNDAEHAHFSARVLGPIYRSIVAACGTRLACLAPYAPTETKVRGGTYYAFQPEDYDPVHEYAAELAIRWYREHRAILKGGARPVPFKCGPKENAQAWGLLVDEFFAGVDRVPACAR